MFVNNNVLGFLLFHALTGDLCNFNKHSRLFYLLTIYFFFCTINLNFYNLTLTPFAVATIINDKKL
jgi:hypothetical protein